MISKKKTIVIVGLLLTTIVSFVYAFQYNETTDNKTITINLSYKSNSSFDINNDGIETIKGIIDLTVENSKFNWDVNETKLFTKWQIYSLDTNKSANVCYGNDEGCNFIELSSIRKGWNETFYSNYGSNGATLNNTISAQIIYYDVSFDIENLYAEIISSDFVSLDAIYYNNTNIPEINQTINLTINETESNNTLINITNQTGYFYWNKTIINVYGNKKEDIVVKLKVPKRLKAIIDEIEIEENKKQGVRIASSNKQKLKNLKKQLKQELKNQFPTAEFNPNLKSIKNIKFNDIKIINDSISVGIEEFNKLGYIQSYAIDPTQLNFTNATVTIVAKGNSLYKCKDWNFTKQKCYGEWKLFKTGLVPGQEYSFILTPDDPGFGESINISSAQHLDEDYTFISNIYDEVKEKDDVWSEPINANEFVRVVYEKNLTNGNVIDVFVRGNGNFEIYEEDKNMSLGNSGFIDSLGEWKYITLENIIEPTDVFDFKISGELEFDYIHDAPSLGWVVLNSSSGTNMTSENLTVYTDQDDNSSLKLIYNWLVDDSSIMLLNMPFEGGSNSTFTRDYAQGNNGTVHNNTVWTSNGGYDGKGAYGFNKANQNYMTVPDFDYGDNFTISFWFKTPPLSGSSYQYVYSHGTWDDYNMLRIYFAESVNNPLYTGIRDYNDDVASRLSVNELDDGNWHFYTLTIENGVGAKVYIDGVFTKSNNTAGTDTFNPETDLYIAERSDLEDRYYGGWIDDLRIHNRVLSVEQIVFLSNSQPNKIHSNETSIGDVWKAQGTPNDGVEDGNTITSNNLTILPDTTNPVINSISDIPDPVNQGQNITIIANVTDNVDVSSVWVEINGTNYTLNQEQIPVNKSIIIRPAKTGSHETNTASNPQNSYDNDNTTYALLSSGRLSVATSSQADLGTINQVFLKGIVGTASGGSGANFDLHWANSSTSQGTSHQFAGEGGGYVYPSYDVTGERSWSFSDFVEMEIHIDYVSGNRLGQIHEIWFEINYTGLEGADIWNISYNTAGLSNGSHNYTVYASDTSNNPAAPQIGNFSVIDVNPPASVTNLTNQSAGLTWIYWNWTNPSNIDFNKTIVYINGSNVQNTSNNYYNATGLDLNTNYTITIHTSDIYGNINNTDVNNTASTLDYIPPTVILVSPEDNYANASELVNVTFECNATDDIDLVNISLYITNTSDEDFALNQTTNVSGTSNSSAWILELGKGNYTWNCLAYDNASESGWGSENRSLRINYTADNAPQITQVQPVSAITLSAFSTKTVNVLFNVTDNDGYSDLNDSLAYCSLSKTGEITRNSSSCTAQDQSGNDLVYNCSLDIYYYDAAGTWNISCYAEDNGGLNATNNTETATVNDLNYVTQNSTNLNWQGLTPGNSDEEASAPVVFTNGGNQDYTSFNITAQNATYDSNTIPRDNFMIDYETGQSSNQTYLNDSGVDWAEGSLLRCTYPCSTNSTEFAYVYVDTPTGILAGVYSSISEWVISLS